MIYHSGVKDSCRGKQLLLNCKNGVTLMPLSVDQWWMQNALELHCTALMMVLHPKNKAL